MIKASCKKRGTLLESHCKGFKLLKYWLPDTAHIISGIFIRQEWLRI